MNQPSKCDVKNCHNAPIYGQHLDVAFADTDQLYHMPPVVFLCEAHKDGAWNEVIDRKCWEMVVKESVKHGLIPLRNLSEIVVERL